MHLQRNVFNAKLVVLIRSISMHCISQINTDNIDRVVEDVNIPRNTC